MAPSGGRVSYTAPSDVMADIPHNEQVNKISLVISHLRCVYLHVYTCTSCTCCTSCIYMLYMYIICIYNTHTHTHAYTHTHTHAHTLGLGLIYPVVSATHTRTHTGCGLYRRQSHLKTLDDRRF